MKKLLSMISAITLVGTVGITNMTHVSFQKNETNHKKQYNDKNDVFLTSSNITNFENRWFEHSSFKPTGYFLKSDEVFTIEFNRKLQNNEIKNIKLTIGQWGNYKNLNNNKNNVFQNIEILNNKNILEFKTNIEGVLYINDNNQTDLYIKNIKSVHEIKNIIKIPTFKINETDQDEFITQVIETNSPFVEFVSKHYIATMQTNMIKYEVLANLKRSFNETLWHWDNIWNWTNEIYGLNEASNDINKKYNQYIHIANSDDSGGYANASNGRIMFHNTYNAGKDLFLLSLKDQWGLWHETGHTYQTQQYKWYNMTETSVNISSLYIAQKMKVKSIKIFDVHNYNKNIIIPFHNLWDSKKEISEYLNKPNTEKDYHKIENVFVKLTMLWQLQVGFGDNFYPILSQKYRLINQIPNSWDNFNNDEKKIQEFIKITSQISGYNLSPFFKKWGLPTTDDTENSIKKLKPLTKQIWLNFNDSETIKKPIVQEKILVLPLLNFSGIKSKNVSVNFGQDYNLKENIKELFIIPDSINLNDLKVKIDYNTLSTINKNISVVLELKQNHKQTNIKTFKFKVNLNNTILFQGINDEDESTYKGIMAFDTKIQKIKFYGNNDIIHNYFNNQIYYNIRFETKYGEFKNLKITGNKTWQQVIKEEKLNDNMGYVEGYGFKITIVPSEGNRVRVFENGKYKPLGGTKQYTIKNNQLIEITK
ncbi:M60 family metallopeptidase [Spiroplasma endosymbiont of Dasysyrphus albostriatus]|uniref:M60 family metallopeptidase n=1 Tax=Spiroplasma endosymbiont of Dasysyrphus albostriatus TaxID=3066299 RepID=UPI0030CE0D25